MTVPRRPSATNHSAASRLRLLLLFFSAALARSAARAFVPATTRAGRHRRHHRHDPDLPFPPAPAAAAAAARGAFGDGTTTAAAATTASAASAIAEIGEITDFASRNGVVLKFTTVGPGYRCVAASRVDPGNVLGYVEGFVRPGRRILHADKMEIFGGGVGAARRAGGEFDGGGTFLGPGLLIAYVCCLHGRDCGCTTAEFLAIDDAEFQHKRLVRYYKMAGFREVRYVGEELRDIPDRLVWGGCGTLMTEDIDVILAKWTRIIRRSSARMED
jgi:hypothetical protein